MMQHDKKRFHECTFGRWRMAIIFTWPGDAYCYRAKPFCLKKTFQWNKPYIVDKECSFLLLEFRFAGYGFNFTIFHSRP